MSASAESFPRSPSPHFRSSARSFLERWQLPDPARIGRGEPAKPGARRAAPQPLQAAPCASADHHLWRNGRLWWVAFCVLEDGWRQERVRLSLGTAQLGEARRRRDALFARLMQMPTERLSLRLSPNRARSQRRKQGG